MRLCNRPSRFLTRAHFTRKRVIADGRNLMVARVVAGKHRIEFPIGKVLYEAPGWVSHNRSPVRSA